MRYTARFIAAITLAAASAAATANAQQAGGAYVVDSRVISDVAVSPTPDSGGKPIGDQAAVSDGTVEYADGDHYYGDGSGRVVDGSGRLAALAHGGEQGPYIPKQYAQPDLFYNYYSNGQNQVNAEMYLSPLPVPPFVGHTWVPYQPLMPHNYLYQHVDRYHNHYDYGRGTNRTRAAYMVAPKQYAETLYNCFRIPR